MFGQSFLLKKVAQGFVEGVCDLLDVDEDEAKDIAKGVGAFVGVGAAILTADAVGAGLSVGEEVVETVVEEAIEEGANNVAEGASGSGAIHFGSNANFDNAISDYDYYSLGENGSNAFAAANEAHNVLVSGLADGSATLDMIQDLINRKLY